MAAVRVFYMRVMNDDMLRPFFEDIDLARLKNKLVCCTQTSVWTVRSIKDRDMQNFRCFCTTSHQVVCPKSVQILTSDQKLAWYITKQCFNTVDTFGVT